MLRHRLLIGLCFGVLAGLLSTHLAGAGSVERIRIADPARVAHGLPAALSVELTSPDTYTRASTQGTSGQWTGPRYESTRTPGDGGTSTIDWTVAFAERPGDAEAAAIASQRHLDWERAERGGFSVPHVIGKRLLGVIPGHYILRTPSLTGGDARFEGVLAFPLDTNLFAVVHLEALAPPDNSYVVQSSIAGSTWNRGQLLLALAGVRLQGPLPPKIVAARTYERGRLIKGKVVDRFLNAVVGARISLERLVGGSWRVVARTTTSGAGLYQLRPSVRGRFRVSAAIPGFSARSREFLAGAKPTPKRRHHPKRR
jgi:hypothetical protein